MTVAILDDIHSAYADTDGVRRLRTRADVDIYTAQLPDAATLAHVDALIANRERTRFTREFLRELPSVRIIVQTGNHAPHIDFEAARQLNILIARAAAGHSAGTVELTIGLAIAVMRRIPACDAAIRRSEWETPLTQVLRGKTFGIIGLGRIGREVASLAAAFGMRVLAYGPRLTDEDARASGVESRSLPELLTESDILSLHAPLNASSLGLINVSRLRAMKSTAVLINTARAALVDEEALVTALQERWIAGAGLDVFHDEPLRTGHPLTTLSNVVLTPHIGWPTDHGYAAFADAACKVLFDYMDGRPVPTFHEGVARGGRIPFGKIL